MSLVSQVCWGARMGTGLPYGCTLVIGGPQAPAPPWPFTDYFGFGFQVSRTGVLCTSAPSLNAQATAGRQGQLGRPRGLSATGGASCCLCPTQGASVLPRECRPASAPASCEWPPTATSRQPCRPETGCPGGSHTWPLSAVFAPNLKVNASIYVPGGSSRQGPQQVFEPQCGLLGFAVTKGRTCPWDSQSALALEGWSLLLVPVCLLVSVFSSGCHCCVS